MWGDRYAKDPQWLSKALRLGTTDAQYLAFERVTREDLVKIDASRTSIGRHTRITYFEIRPTHLPWTRQNTLDVKYAKEISGCIKKKANKNLPDVCESCGEEKSSTRSLLEVTRKHPHPFHAYTSSNHLYHDLGTTALSVTSTERRVLFISYAKIGRRYSSWKSVR